MTETALRDLTLAPTAGDHNLITGTAGVDDTTAIDFLSELFKIIGQVGGQTPNSS